MKTRPRLAVISCMIVLGVYFLIRLVLVKEPTSDLPAINKGKAIFNTNCMSCHGINGPNTIYEIDVNKISDNYSFKQQNNLHKLLLKNLNEDEKELMKLYIQFEKTNLVKP